MRNYYHRLTIKFSRSTAAACPRLAALLGGLLFLLCLTALPVAAASHKQAEREVRRGEYERAVETYRKLLEKDRRDLRARLGICYALLKFGRYDLAYQQASQAVVFDPMSARAHSLFGLALLRSGNFQLSFEEFRTALQFDPKDALAVAGLGEIDFYENRRQDSFEKLKLATELEPNEPDYYFQLGHAASRNELYNEAADAYQRFLQLAPLKDQDRRDRIRGLIQFFRYIGTIKLMRLGGKPAAVVPFTMHQFRPYIDVKLNGQGPFKFVLDSGASIPVISQETARKLGLRPIARGGHARAIGGSGSFEIIYGFLDHIELDGIRIEAVPVFFRTLTRTPDQDPTHIPAGYIGLSVMSKFITTLDYKNKKLLLARPSALPPATVPAEPEPFIDIPLRTTNNGLVSAETRLNKGTPLSFIVDTGATTTAVAKVAADRLPPQERKLANYRITIIGAAGITENVEVLSIGELGVSNLLQKNVRAPILDFTPINETSGFEQAGILGGDFLSHFQVVFDFQQMRLRLKPETGAIIVQPPVITQEVEP